MLAFGCSLYDWFHISDNDPRNNDVKSNTTIAKVENEQDNTIPANPLDNSNKTAKKQTSPQRKEPKKDLEKIKKASKKI